jgi:hypothetical protein
MDKFLALSGRNTTKMAGQDQILLSIHKAHLKIPTLWTLQNKNNIEFVVAN